jgi:[FeFe] hydrogenase H-cluster maturation GTPase HydF
MNSTPRGNRLHIAVLGRRNAGKSSLVNALTNQDTALVSHIPGTTTDPVFKSMELLPLGPVVIIDTAGIDDSGELGKQRIQRTQDILDQADMVLLVLDSELNVSSYEENIVRTCLDKKVPALVILNKADITRPDSEKLAAVKQHLGLDPLVVSSRTGQGLNNLKAAMIKSAPANWDNQTIVGDLLNPGDLAVLVVPIDTAAPRGRLILPQVQVIRDILDHDAMAYVVKERNLHQCMNTLTEKPRIVITDSQAFAQANAETPPDVLLTSFSILFARYKGDLETLIAGARAIKNLAPGDKVLIAEACTHHRMGDDIGTVKIPRWLNQSVGGELDFAWSSGGSFPKNLDQYKLVIHCGACMINRREMLSRIMQVNEAGVAVVNYGVCIAYLHGILKRALSPFPGLQNQI